MTHVFVPDALTLKRLDPLTYWVVNTRILIRRCPKEYSDDREDSWDVFDAGRLNPVDTAGSLRAAKNLAREIIDEAHAEYWKDVPEGD